MIDATDVAVYVAAGAFVGAVYFLLLLWTVNVYTRQVVAVPVSSLYVARVAMAVSAFWMIAQQGAAPLLFALLGFLIARSVVQRSCGTPWSWA